MPGQPKRTLLDKIDEARSQGGSYNMLDNEIRKPRIPDRTGKKNHKDWSIGYYIDDNGELQEVAVKESGFIDSLLGRGDVQMMRPTGGGKGEMIDKEEAEALMPRVQEFMGIYSEAKRKRSKRVTPEDIYKELTAGNGR